MCRLFISLVCDTVLRPQFLAGMQPVSHITHVTLPPRGHLLLLLLPCIIYTVLYIEHCYNAPHYVCMAPLCLLTLQLHTLL